MPDLITFEKRDDLLRHLHTCVLQDYATDLVPVSRFDNKVRQAGDQATVII
jgi:hypothetical protein